jgi:hypothetical protein
MEVTEYQLLIFSRLSISSRTPIRFSSEGGVFMRIVISVALGMLIAAPLFGRWRASVWMKKRLLAEQKMDAAPFERMRSRLKT